MPSSIGRRGCCDASMIIVTLRGGLQSKDKEGSVACTHSINIVLATAVKLTCAGCRAHSCTAPTDTKTRISNAATEDCDARWERKRVSLHCEGHCGSLLHARSLERAGDASGTSYRGWWTSCRVNAPYLDGQEIMTR